MAKISKVNGSATKKLKKGKKRRHEMKDDDHANGEKLQVVYEDKTFK